MATMCDDDAVECDCCGWKEDMEYTLIWVNAEGFEPLDGEVLKDEAYEYDALCDECYKNFLLVTTKTFTCCLCHEETQGYGNNAEPLYEGLCCDGCNEERVIKFRSLVLVQCEEILAENATDDWEDPDPERHFELCGKNYDCCEYMGDCTYWLEHREGLHAGTLEAHILEQHKRQEAWMK